MIGIITCIETDEQVSEERVGFAWPQASECELSLLQFVQLSAAACHSLQQSDRPCVHPGAAIGRERLSDNHHLHDSVESVNGNMRELPGDVKESEGSGRRKPS